jgi:hypothetical protein
LGAFGDDFSHSKNDFGASFNGMIQDIENISYTPNASSGSDTSKPMNYTREAFEGSRLGFSEKLGEVSTVDEISAIIVKDKEMKAKLDKLILNFGQPISPLAAIEKLLSQNSDKSLIKKILRKVGGKKNTKVVSRLNKALEEGNFDAVRAEVFNKGLTYHPGLKNILLDPALFNRASENLKTGDKSLVMSAQSNKDFVDHFGQRCESLQKKFAEAVCVKTADLKSKVSKQEMITVLANDKILNSSNGENREAINLTLCAMSYNQVSMGSAFSGFLPNEPFSVSDYQDRKEHRSFEDQNNIFSNYAKLNAQKSPMSEQINNVASSVSYGRHSSGQLKSSSASNISEAPSLFGAKHLDDRAMVDSLGSTKLTSPTNSSGNTAVKDVESSTPERLDSNPVTDKSSYQVSNITPSTPQFTNSVTPTISKTTEVKEQPTNDEQVSPSREELKNSFTGKEQKKIDGYLSNISDADAQELNRYRAESKKEREAVTDSRLELERLKTLELKAQYEELEKKLALLKKEKSSLADNNSSSGSSNSGGYQEANQEQEKGISNFSGKTNTTNFQATGGSASGNSSAIGGNTQASGQFRDPSSNSNATTGRDLSGKVADGMSLVIKSQAGNGQASAEDPSSELITYLTKNETDSKTLRDLKESGLIYTYEVNENGATVQKKKVIKYTELSVEAKALVDKKISILVEKESSDLERQITSLKRTYSIQALKLEILSSNQSGSLN